MLCNANHYHFKVFIFTVDWKQQKVEVQIILLFFLKANPNQKSNHNFNLLVESGKVTCINDGTHLRGGGSGYVILRKNVTERGGVG